MKCDNWVLIFVYTKWMVGINTKMDLHNVIPFPNSNQYSCIYYGGLKMHSNRTLQLQCKKSHFSSEVIS